MTPDDTAAPASTTQTAVPSPKPGADLEAFRSEMGVSKKELAKRLSIARTTLDAWEDSPKVDAIRVGRYEKAVRQLVAEAVAQ